MAAASLPSGLEIMIVFAVALTLAASATWLGRRLGLVAYPTNTRSTTAAQPARTRHTGRGVAGRHRGTGAIATAITNGRRIVIEKVLDTGARLGNAMTSLALLPGAIAGTRFDPRARIAVARTTVTRSARPRAPAYCAPAVPRLTLDEQMERTTRSITGALKRAETIRVAHITASENWTRPAMLSKSCWASWKA